MRRASPATSARPPRDAPAVAAATAGAAPYRRSNTTDTHGVEARRPAAPDDALRWLIRRGSGWDSMSRRGPAPTARRGAVCRQTTRPAIRKPHKTPRRSRGTVSHRSRQGIRAIILTAESKLGARGSADTRTRKLRLGSSPRRAGDASSRGPSGLSAPPRRCRCASRSRRDRCGVGRAGHCCQRP